MRLMTVGVVLTMAGHACAHTCFQIAYDDNTAATNKTFAARKCQGGGVTWAGLLHEALRQRGPVKEASDPPRDLGGAVYRVGASFVGIDDEADSVQVCSTDKPLIAWLRQEHRHLNTDTAALGKALDAAPATETECFAKKR